MSKSNNTPKKPRSPTDKPDIPIKPGQLRFHKFLDLWLNHNLPATKAAVQAGYSKSYANRITTELKGPIGQKYAAYLQKHGITMDYLAQKEKEHLDDESKHIQGKALERIYKLKKLIGSDENTPPVQNNIIYQDNRVLQVTKEYEQKLRDELTHEIHDTYVEKDEEQQDT